MIGWPLSRSCAVACLFGDESQQPILPHVMHMRRCTQPLPIFKHSSQPSIFSGSAVTSTRSRWLQMELPADMPSPLAFGVTLAPSGRVREHEGNREIARTVGPPGLDSEPGPAGLELELLAAELRADLNSERLALVERHVEPETLDRDGVRLPRAEADVHPLVPRIPASLVHEAPLVERRAQLTVDRGESVADEHLGHAPAVVVGRLQSGDVLDEVDPEQERVVSRKRSSQCCEEPSPLLGVQVADRASQEGDQTAATPWELAEMALEVTDDRMDEDSWVGGRDRLRARSQGMLAQVERNKALERAGGVERGQEETRVLRGPGAELDKRARLREPRDLARPGPQDLALAPREVVLRQPSDLLVQPRAPLVVEPDRRQLLHLGVQAPERRLVQDRATVVLVE